MLHTFACNGSFLIDIFASEESIQDYHDAQLEPVEQ